MLDWHWHCMALRRRRTAKDLKRGSHTHTHEHFLSATKMMVCVCVCTAARQKMNSINSSGIKRQWLKHWKPLRPTPKTSLPKHYVQVPVISSSISGLSLWNWVYNIGCLVAPFCSQLLRLHECIRAAPVGYGLSWLNSSVLSSRFSSFLSLFWVKRVGLLDVSVSTSRRVTEEVH